MITQDEVELLWRRFNKDIIRDVDGYYVYWPTGNNGAWSPHYLRLLAELIDIANYQWHQVIISDPVFKE